MAYATPERLPVLIPIDGVVSRFVVPSAFLTNSGRRDVHTGDCLRDENETDFSFFRRRIGETERSRGNKGGDWRRRDFFALYFVVFPPSLARGRMGRARSTTTTATTNDRRSMVH